MRGVLYKKGMVLVIICLFIGAGVVPSISGNVGIVNKEPDEKNICMINNKGPSVDDWCIIDTVGLWHFNECLGDIAFDSSGHGNGGGCYGTEWVSGPPDYGCALLFNASKNSYVYVDDDPSLDFDGLGEDVGFMIDFWMAVNEFPTEHYSGLVSKQYKGGYMVDLTTENQIVFHIITSEGITAKHVASNSKIYDNDWHHIVAVWDGATLYLYIDDMTQPDNSLYVGDFTIGDVSKWLEIGNDWATDSLNPFDGMIDEVQISIVGDDGTPPRGAFYLS